MTEKWETTVDELVRNFRAALVALVPIVERAHIGWRDQEASDWDDVTEPLWRRLVVEPLARGVIDPGETPPTGWATENEYVLEDVRSGDELRLPRYGLNYFSYRDMSYIGVEEGRRKAIPRVFVGFGTDASPFDVAFCRVLSRRDSPRDFEQLPVDGLALSLMHLRPSGVRDRLKALSIPA